MIQKVNTRLLLLFGLLFSTSACTDLSSYDGIWRGNIVAEDVVRQGFGADVEATLELEHVALSTLTANLSTSDGRFDQARLNRITKVASDQLASITFDGDPIRTYLLFAEDSINNQTTTFFLSLFQNDRLQLRALSGNSLYGIFHFTR